MAHVVIFGAGNIGRGFIGQLCSESGLEVVFVDVVDELIELFNSVGEYEVHEVFNEQRTVCRIGPVRGIHAKDTAAVAEAVATAVFGATAVGARALPYLAPNLAAGFEQRQCESGASFDLLLCENLKNATSLMRREVSQVISDEVRDYLDSQVGFVDTVIGRMVPIQDPEELAANPGMVRVEPYKELPVNRDAFAGRIPPVDALQAEADFANYTARKLYIHNCGHALLAYCGWRRGHETGPAAMDDETVHDFLRSGWEESAAGIVHKYGIPPAWLAEHMDDLDRRFRNRALGDTLFRLGRDPIRKLGPTDRLVAPAKLADEAGLLPSTLVRGIAMALAFDAEDDPVAMELQRRLRDEGLPALLPEICQIQPDEPLGQAIIAAYGEFSQVY